MGMKSKGYALVLCASLLCIGSAWGEGDCPSLGANAPLPAAGEHNQVNGRPILRNTAPDELAVNFKPVGQNVEGNCLYKSASGAELELGQ